MIEKLQSGQINFLLLLAIFFGIGTVLFGSLAVVAFNQRNQAQLTIDAQINRAVIKAKAEQKKASDEQYAKESQLPYRTFTANQADGAFQLQIPKNWSLYAERSAAGQAQLTLIANQDAVVVNKGGNNTQPFKLQLVRQTALDVVKKYQQDIKTKKISAKTVKVSGIDATQLEGVLDSDRHDGIMVIVPVRDKALVFVTESRSFVKEFSEIVGTAKINP